MKKHRKNKTAPPPGLPPEAEPPIGEQPKKQPFLKRLLFGEETPDLSELEAGSTTILDILSPTSVEMCIRDSFLNRCFLLRCCFGFFSSPFRDVVNDAAGSEAGVVRQLLRRHFVEERGLVTLEQRQTLPVLQAQDFIGVHQVTLCVASRLRIRACGRIYRREQRHHRHLVIEDGDRHLAAFLRNIFCRRQAKSSHPKGFRFPPHNLCHHQDFCEHDDT